MAGSEIDGIRALLGSKPRPVGWAERRQRLDEVGSTWPVAPDVRCEAVDCDGIPGEWSRVPDSDTSRVLLYFHGGGYCSGSILSHRRLVTEAGRAARMRTLAIDYRRAPEHPYPAAHENALTAWRFLRKQGIAAKRIAVGGDSAGGNLTLGLIQRLRASGEDLPGCAWLLSPWTDLTQSGASYRSRAEADPMITKAGLDTMAAAYLDGGSADDPIASPLFADLTGLPPLLVHVGDAEMLLDDSVRLHERAVAAGVDATLQVWDDMIHVFQAFPPELLPESDESIAGIAEFLADRLA